MVDADHVPDVSVELLNNKMRYLNISFFLYTKIQTIWNDLLMHTPLPSRTFARQVPYIHTVAQEQQ